MPSSSSSLRSFDVFVKPLEGTRTRTAAGGIITLLSYGAAAILLVAQLCLYMRGEVRHSLHLAESASSPTLARPYATPLSARSGGGYGGNGAARSTLLEALQEQASNRIPLKVHVTFPHVSCRDIDFAHDNASKSSGEFHKLHGRDGIRARVPTMDEMAKSTGGGTATKAARLQDGCTVEGTIRVPRVGGTLSVTVSRRAWQEATSIFNFISALSAPKPDAGAAISSSSGAAGGTNDDASIRRRLPNCTHYVHSVTFGEPFPLATDPLRNALNVVDNESGVALHSVNVKLVPTVYRRPRYPWTFFLAGGTRRTYQASVTEHVVQPHTLAAQRSPMLPGMLISYDFTPLAVHHVEYRDNVLVFLGSLVSIVGGVFVTVGLVTSCLYNSAAAVAKKID